MTRQRRLREYRLSRPAPIYVGIRFRRHPIDGAVPSFGLELPHLYA